MRIRTVTLGVDLELPAATAPIAEAGRFLRAAKIAFQSAGFEVQTLRLAAQPFNEVTRNLAPGEMVAGCVDLESACQSTGIEYISLGTLWPDSGEDLWAAVPEILNATQRSFISATVATPQSGIHFAAISRSSEIVAKLSAGPGGPTTEHTANQRFAVLANCAPNCPFFPTGYHGGGQAKFTVGLESAGLVASAFANSSSLLKAGDALVESIESNARRLELIANHLAVEFGVSFGGLDFSTAPLPNSENSVAAAVESLGVKSFGNSGTLFAIALITSTLRRARYKKAGFSGVFLPVMEDSVLAERNREGMYTLDSLLLYSSVCGTGLDTIPLPGDITVAELASMILDVATLATVLDKPLTARLIPLKGKVAGDIARSTSEYFADTSIFPARGSGGGRLVNRNEVIRLR